MKSMKRLIITFLLFFVSVRQAGGIKTPPRVADVFGVDLEISIYSDYPNGRITSLVALDYDKYRNQIAVKILSIGNVEHVIVDFNSSQIFKLDERSGCTSDKCSDESESVCREELNGLFPQMEEFTLSFNQIFPGLELFGETPWQLPIPAGSEVWANITTDKWVTNYKNAITSAYWTSNWITPLAPSWGAIPVLVQIQFKLRPNDSAKTRQQIVPVDYDPRKKSADELFQPREGIYCSEWPNTREFPSEFKFTVFQFGTESIKENDAVVAWSREWFDLDSGFVRIDYQSTYENSTVTLIVDYNRDMIYEIGKGRCKLDLDQNDLHMQIRDSPSILSLFKPIKSVGDFFGKANYKFVGTRQSTRTIESLVWQGIQSNLLGKARVEALLEWYFDKPSFEVGKYVPTRRSYKVITVDKAESDSSQELVLPGDKIVHQIYGFRVTTKESINEIFDVLSCYPPSEIIHLEFEIKETSKNDAGVVIETISKPEFRFKWRQLVSSGTKMGLLSVAGLDCLPMNDKLFIRFKLLKLELHVEKMIEDKIDGGKFDASWTDENTRKWSFVAVPGSLTTGKPCIPSPTNPPASSSTTSTETTINAVTEPTINAVTEPTTTTTSTSLPEGSPLRSKGLAAGVAVGCFMFGLSFGVTVVFLFRSKLLRYF